MVFACRQTTFKMLRGRYQTLFFLVLLAVGLLTVASEETSDEDPLECPVGSQPKPSTGDDDGDDDEQPEPCVAALDFEPTEDDPPPAPPATDDADDDAPPSESTLTVHYF